MHQIEQDLINDEVIKPRKNKSDATDDAADDAGGAADADMASAGEAQKEVENEEIEIIPEADASVTDHEEDPGDGTNSLQCHSRQGRRRPGVSSASVAHLFRLMCLIV